MVLAGRELGASAREGLDQRSHARVKDGGLAIAAAVDFEYEVGLGAVGRVGCQGK